MSKITFDANFDNLDEIREFVGDAARQVGFSEKEIYAIQLAADEASSNIIEHAYKGRTGQIQMTIDLLENPCELAIELHDTGKAASLENVKQPNLEEPQEKGYGLFLMQQLMDSVEYFPEEGNNRWRLTKRL